MADQMIIRRIKKDNRITHDKLDDDIGDTIDQCIEDLKLVGINNADAGDLNILTAVKLWCRANYADSLADRIEYRKCYEKIKAVLKTSGRYGGAADDE